MAISTFLGDPLKGVRLPLEGARLRFGFISGRFRIGMIMGTTMWLFLEVGSFWWVSLSKDPYYLGSIYIKAPDVRKLPYKQGSGLQIQP